jgi:hypothetical protein
MKNKITLSQWNELTVDGKEKLRLWAVNHKSELDLVPKDSDDFSLSCDYAALLTTEQLNK